VSAAELMSHASVLAAIITGLILFVRSRGTARLDEVITASLAGAALPPTVLLVYGGFDPAIVTSLTGLRVYIAVAGCVLVCILARKLRRSLTR